MPTEPGNRADEQVAVGHADASGSDISENQHEEDRTRDIHVGKRGPEAAGEEQPDKLRKAVRFEQEASSSSAAASSDPTVALEYPASGATRQGSVLVQTSGHVDDDVQNFRVGCILAKESLHRRSVGKFDRDCVQESTKTKKHGKIQRALPASQLLSAMPPLEAVKVLVSIMMSVSLSERMETMRVETLRHQQSTTSKEQPRDSFTSKYPAEDRQKYGKDKVDRLIKSMYGTQDASHIWQFDDVNLICGELGGFRRGKHSAALFHNPNQGMRMAMHGDDFVCLSDDDRLKHIDSLPKSRREESSIVE